MQCYFNGLFCSVVISGTSYFFSFFFRKWFWQELIFGMTSMAFACQAGQNECRKENPQKTYFESGNNRAAKKEDLLRLPSAVSKIQKVCASMLQRSPGRYW